MPRLWEWLHGVTRDQGSELKRARLIPFTFQRNVGELHCPQMSLSTACGAGAIVYNICGYSDSTSSIEAVISTHSLFLVIYVVK